MERASAGPAIALKAHGPKMAQLAVAEPTGRPTIYDEADSHAGPDGDVGKVVETPARAPSHLGSSRAVHVRIESGLRACRDAAALCNVGPGPIGLGGLGNEAPGRIRY